MFVDVPDRSGSQLETVQVSRGRHRNVTCTRVEEEINYHFLLRMTAVLLELLIYWSTSFLAECIR